MRGRNRKSQNPLSRVFESNGPDVKIRGSATHIAEKYVQLARDAQGSGDPVAAENYYQHAEHYFRLIAAAQEQYRQNQPFYRPENEGRADDSYDDGEDDGPGVMEPGYAAHEPQPYLPRESQPFPPRDAQAYPPREPQPYPSREPQPHYNRQPAAQAANADASVDVERLPSFITGGGGAPAHPANGQNGAHEPGPQQQQSDRYPSHRRRRRHRGPRSDAPQAGEDARPQND
jgi:hypothetical protein